MSCAQEPAASRGWCHSVVFRPSEWWAEVGRYTSLWAYAHRVFHLSLWAYAHRVFHLSLLILLLTTILAPLITSNNPGSPLITKHNPASTDYLTTTLAPLIAKHNPGSNHCTKTVSVRQFQDSYFHCFIFFLGSTKQLLRVGVTADGEHCTESYLKIS